MHIWCAPNFSVTLISLRILALGSCTHFRDQDTPVSIMAILRYYIFWQCLILVESVSDKKSKTINRKFQGSLMVFSDSSPCGTHRIFSNLIRTSFCRFLKRKKKKRLVRGSNPHLSFNRPLPTRQTDWKILDVTSALTVTWLRRRVWSRDWVTDNDSVMRDDGEPDD